MWRIVQSPFGLHLQAIRDNARKAEYLGVQVRRFRLAAFVISAVFGAIGGAILGFRIGLADPELVYWTHSGHLVFMAVLGGFANFFGPIVGALAFMLLQDQLQSITQYWRFVLGAILALMVVVLAAGHCRASPSDCQRRHRAGRCGMTAAARDRGMSASPTARFARSRTSACRHAARASSSPSSARTAPARRRWSMSSPGCWGRPRAKCLSWAATSPESGRSSSPSSAWRARSSWSTSSRS